MRKIIFLFFICICGRAHSQEWIQLMNDPEANFYDVQRSFNQWKDSAIELLSKAPGEKEEQKEYLEEAEEIFQSWSRSIQNNIDETGNRLPNETMWKRYGEYKNINTNKITSQAQGNWIARGPFNVIPKTHNKGVGMMWSLAINPNDTNIIYAGSPNGGLWKTTDEGNTWLPLTDSIASLGTSAIAIDPVNSNTVYVIIAGRLFKTIDGGTSWVLLNTGTYLTGAYYGEKILFDPINSQNIFILKTDIGIIKSSDGGNSWSLINSILFKDLKMKAGNPSTLFGLQGNYFFQSTDGGITFDTIATLSMQHAPNEIAVTPADSNYVYIIAANSGSGGQVALSTDGGATFITQPNSTELNAFNSLQHIAVSPTDKNLVFFGGINIAKSVDAGLTWNNLIRYDYNIPGLPFVHLDQRSICFVGNSFWTGNDGGVYKSEDGGITFIDKTSNLLTTQLTSLDCSLSDTTAMLAGAWDNAFMQHTDSGWTCVYAGDGFNVAINPSNSLDLFLKEQYNFHRSTDGGITASNLNGITENPYGFTANYPVKFNPQNNNSVFLLIKNVWKSVDGGVNFNSISNFATNTGGGFLYIVPTDSNFIYTASHKTIDGGVTWTDLVKPSTGILKLAVDPAHPNRIWSLNAFQSATIINYSSDSGNTWQQLSNYDLPAGLAKNLKYVNNGYDGLLLAGSGVYYIDNRLSNWQPMNNGLPYVTVSDLYVLENINKVRAATYGRGIWEGDLYDSTQAPVADFLSDKTTICPGESVTFYDNSLGSGPGFNTVYSWIFAGGTPGFSSLLQPVITYNIPGTYAVTLNISGTNGTDSITKTTYINVQFPTPLISPASEGFEPPVFPPSGWKITDFDFITTWMRTHPGGYGLSSWSALVTNFTLFPPQRDILFSPAYDLSAQQNPILFFDYAYAMDSTHSDTLKIFYTTDCNITRTYIYSKGGVDLSTAPVSNSFYPDSNEWKTDTLNLSGITGIGSIQFGFEANSYNGDNLFIDNINLASGSGTAISEIPSKNNELLVFPNPSKNSLDIRLGNRNKISGTIALTNFLGGQIFEKNITSSENIVIDVSGYNDGIYLLNLFCENKYWSQKVIISK